MALKLENNIGSKFNLTHANNAGEISLTSKDLTSTAYSVETIEELATVPAEFNTVIVKDLDRGGIFIYDSTKVDAHNGGTNFNGWIRQYSGAINVKWFGAKGNNSEDDTSALVNALDFAQQSIGWNVYIPSGKYLISESLVITKSEGVLRGDGPASTNIILTSSTVERVIDISSDTRIFRTTMHGFRVSSNAEDCIATAFYIKNLSGGNFSNIDIYNTKYGFEITGYRPDGSSNIFIDKVNIRNLKAGTGIGFWLKEVVDLFVNTVTVNAPDGSEYYSAIVVENCQSAWFSNIDCLKATNGLHLKAETNSIITWLFFESCAFDKNTRDGIRVSVEDATGIIKGVNFVNCWSSGNTSHGISVYSPTGVASDRLTGVSFNSHRSVNNGEHGLRIGNCEDVHFSNGFIAGNSQKTIGTYNGVQVEANTKSFQIRGNRIGNALRYGVTHKRNILIVAGSSDNYIVSENNLLGYVTSGITDAANGASSYVNSNIV